MFVAALVDLIEHVRVAGNLHRFIRPSEAMAARPRKFSRLFEFVDTRRGKSVRTSFADFLDLLALALSVGLPPEQAWTSALEYLPPCVLSRELGVFSQALSAGRSRTDAFRELRDRLGEPSAQMTLVLIEHAMERGNMIGDTLHDQASAFRNRRFIEIEREAQQASMKLLFPLFVFILPAVFLILLGPLIIQLSQGLSLF